MNICASSGRLCRAVCIVLMTIRFSNPCAPLIFARHTSAIPPAASRESISYLLNSVPGSQGDGDGGAAVPGSRFQVGRRRRGVPALRLPDAEAEDEPMSSRARTTGIAAQRRSEGKT